ncbi:putative deacylase [Halalkaliarchaeum sp. AArc-CO]|uniref:succinylglutamate desuccinylase/aspartoacylase family protein n=1 Tax=unclassified Halalkaliarchaeum TaxID=2678344 RepID=UPI00217DC7FD|nr:MULTISPECIES: succinylglutamate desuccinylase/aspartoacylase family protein [unclassified Halalkaliarchaeum]MDR5672482.1 succinylglutamate desuccinylase/aspartoacylase family protein [Halalkaliarchaeum sp. AArc-GB]UWG50568.1 putative deacylase [Halalkaliarchaeum sp. AArc-CO]
MHTAETLTLARLPSGVPLSTTIHTYGDGEPVVYVQAAQHGREVNGTEVLRRLHGTLLEADLDGTVVAVPIADPLTFDRVAYVTPEPIDPVNSNMNRVWPGDPEGTVHERMADRLWEYAGRADYAVDLHTGSPDTLIHTVYYEGEPSCRRLAEAFGTDLLLAEPAGDDADTEWDQRSFAGKFRVAATREGIPTITPELAHNRQLVEPAIEAGVDGILEVLREVGILTGEPQPWDGTVARNHLGRIRATDSGLFRPADVATLGREVSPGDRLGTLYHPTTYEELQAVKADREGILYSVTREPTVTAGSSLVGVAERVE